jgi:hypothetical protein
MSRLLGVRRILRVAAPVGGIQALDGQSHRPHGWLTGADRSNVVLAAELEVPTNGVDADAVFEYVGALESTTYRSSCAHSKEPG